LLTTEERNIRILAALQKKMPHVKNFSHDIGLPTKAVGHSIGLQTASRIGRSYRSDHRPRSQYVEPQPLIQVLRDAGVKRWVLMGLYGYVGYLAMPRATQDVDILIDENELELAVSAILVRWPALQVDRQEVVVRFRDPGEVSITGEVMQVIDLMLPSNECYQAVLDRYHRIDEETGNPIPIIEAACASKFAAIVFPHRSWEKKAYDAADLRSIFVPNYGTIDRDLLDHLGNLVYEGGGKELLEFLELAKQQKPFPV